MGLNDLQLGDRGRGGRRDIKLTPTMKSSSISAKKRVFFSLVGLVWVVRVF